MIDKDWKDVYTGDPGYFDACINKVHETSKDLFLNHSSNLWKVIKGFCKKLYGDNNEGFDKIAISNLIKCNLGEVNDKIPSEMRYNCSHKEAGLEVANNEAEILSPKLIISLAGSKYNDYLKNWDHNRYKIMSHLPHPSARGTHIDAYVEELYHWVCPSHQ